LVEIVVDPFPGRLIELRGVFLGKLDERLHRRRIN
jgi:hypothetical protein